MSRSAALDAPAATPGAPPADAQRGRIVVGIGSSAGGIEALQELFAKLTVVRCCVRRSRWHMPSAPRW